MTLKRTDIVAGKMYSDGRGNVRLVLAEGPAYMTEPEQREQDCIRYKVIVRKRGPNPVGTELNCTRAAFASWAKEEVKKNILPNWATPRHVKAV